jgi:excisionase family DNA binding protein
MIATPNRLTYSVREAAKLTGLSTRSIHRLISDDRLHSTLVGGRRLIPVDGLLNLVGVSIRSRMDLL